jgi:hypothetical protein
VSELVSNNCCGTVCVYCCCEKLVAEVGDNSGTQRKGNVCRLWKMLPSNNNEDMTVDTSVCAHACVCVCAHVCMRACEL